MGVPRVAEALARLAVFAVDDFSVDDMLHRLGEVAAAALAVDGAGVMGTVGADGSRTRFVHSSQLSLTPLERLQELNQSGPCKEATLTLRTVVCSTQQQLERWPAFAAAAQDAGVRSVVAVPMISRGRCWGVLDLYWMSETVHDEDELAEAELLAEVAVSYLVIADDRHEADLARQQLAARLLHDTLTGLANRELIHELTYHALANAGRRRKSVALLFIDLDKFKDVNDTRGHRAGDIVLRTVAHRMRAVVRASDTASRLGGDEFLVLCDDLDHNVEEAGLIGLGERILAEIAKPIDVDDGRPVVMGASIGIAVTSVQPWWPTSSTTPTRRCTRPRTNRGAASSSIANGTTSEAAVDRPLNDRYSARSTEASYRCSTSRSSRRPTTSWQWRRCCGGSTPRPGCSPRLTSSISPSPPDPSCGSGSGWSVRCRVNCALGATHTSMRPPWSCSTCRHRNSSIKVWVR